MTAEIAIVNRHAIALAADSAVTIGRERVWKSSNKLFSLGPLNDIAVMVSGAGDFAGIPWEPIVKLFREEKCGTQFATTKECADEFMKFLEDNRFAPDQRSRIVHLSIYLERLETLHKRLPKFKRKRDFKSAIITLCQSYTTAAQQETALSIFPSKKEFIKLYKDDMTQLAQEVFKERIVAAVSSALFDFLYEFAIHEMESSYISEIVIAGFGKKEIFPSIYNYVSDGKDSLFVRKWLKYWRDFNADNTRKTAIIPFGQADIFHLFMEGVSPEYVPFLKGLLARVLEAKSKTLIDAYVAQSDRLVEEAAQRKDNRVIVEKFDEEFDTYRRRQTILPIVDVVRALPKDEMAELAGALVELTSLRRKVDSPLESVGGPVDVAVISKGDGLIWVRRKHYFDIARNPDFMIRKDRRGSASHDAS